jgi:hypothetical protein
MTKLSAENFKRLKVIEISPNPVGITLITGGNAQGKSSAIDAFLWVMGAISPDVPIRSGTEKASVRLEFGGLVFEKTQKKGKNAKLEVFDKATGALVKSPATFINNLFGGLEKNLALDILSLLDAQPKKQREVFVDFLGIAEKMEALDTQRFALVKKRTEARSVTESFERQIAGLGTIPPGLPDKPVSNATVMEKFNAAQATAQSNAAARQSLAGFVAALEVSKRTIGEINAEIAKAQKDLEVARAANSDLTDKMLAARAACESLVDPSTSDIAEELANVQKTNEAIAKRDSANALRMQRDAAEKNATTIGEQIEKLDAEQKAAIGNAEWPVEGMGFSETGLMLNDLPFEQAAESEQIDALLRMVMKADNPVKVIPIRNASGILEPRKRLIQEAALKHGYSVLMEQADESGKVGIVIQDGEVVAVNESEKSE